MRDANGQALSYVYYESEPERQSATKTKLLNKEMTGEVSRSPISVEQPLLAIRSVLMRKHALTGRHVQYLRQILTIRAENFFIDDAG